jgi:hypothetical protein
MKGKLTKDNDGYWLDISEDGITKLPLSDFGQLSKENCDEIFGIFDVEKLFLETPHTVEDEKDYWKIRAGYIEGFNKAMELNKDKLFTLDDMKEAYGRGFLQQGIKSFNSLIQSLQQPTEIEVEIEMDICGDKVYAVPEPKLDENGCLILTKNII